MSISVFVSLILPRYMLFVNYLATLKMAIVLDFFRDCFPSNYECQSSRRAEANHSQLRIPEQRERGYA